jgi:hypothetical protein
MGFLLFLIAYILFLPLTIWNYFLVKGNGYWLSSALSLDKYTNREFRTLWNKYLRTKDGYKFGVDGETISSALGKNQRDGTLTKTGKRLVYLLNKLDENHCQKSIQE